MDIWASWKERLGGAPDQASIPSLATKPKINLGQLLDHQASDDIAGQKGFTENFSFFQPAVPWL